MILTPPPHGYQPLASFSLSLSSILLTTAVSVYRLVIMYSTFPSGLEWIWKSSNGLSPLADASAVIRAEGSVRRTFKRSWASDDAYPAGTRSVSAAHIVEDALTAVLSVRRLLQLDRQYGSHGHGTLYPARATDILDKLLTPQTPELTWAALTRTLHTPFLLGVDPVAGRFLCLSVNQLQGL